MRLVNRCLSWSQSVILQMCWKALLFALFCFQQFQDSLKLVIWKIYLNRLEGKQNLYAIFLNTQKRKWPFVFLQLTLCFQQNHHAACYISKREWNILLSEFYPLASFFFFFKENNKKSLLRGIEKSASKAQKTPMAPTKGSVSFVLCFAVSYRSCVFGLGVLL